MRETVTWRCGNEKVELAIARKGRGPTVLLLPALSSISTIGEMAPLQEQLTDGFETVAIDWPGFGRMSRPALPLSPEHLRGFLNEVLGSIVPRPEAIVAAGHAAGYVLGAAARQSGLAGRLVLVAPTWRGPLPTMMGRRSRLGDRIVRLGDMPFLGHALYRLNVNPIMVRLMAREHVYSDRDWLDRERMAEKAKVTRARGARHASLRFVTGGLDPMPDREAFLRAASAVVEPVLVIYGDETPRRSKAEMAALAALPNVRVMTLPRGKLALHEECPGEVAEAVRAFLAVNPAAST